ncbi:MAG: hypothetical protein LC733_00560 [Actinobacteria bacterium]|nr:hypothetical protein [Actinomycetota bacterium]
MNDDARAQEPSIEEDRDRVDFAWVNSLARRLGRRMFPESDAAEGALTQNGPGGQVAVDTAVPPSEDGSAEAPAEPPAAEPTAPAPVLTTEAPGPMADPLTEDRPPETVDSAGLTLIETVPARPGEDRVEVLDPGTETGTPVVDPETQAEAEPPPEPPPPPGLIRHLRRVAATEPYRGALDKYTLPVVLVIGVAIVSMINHFSGVDWGDDFALYMRQARGLTIGNIGEVVSANRFAVENSGWSSFSPYIYPWGWPLLVSPLYALFGLNYEVFKILQVVAFCVFLLVFFAMVRPRAGTSAATILTLLIGVSRSFVGATDTVLSDLPYLCFVGLSLWFMDRCRVREILEESRNRLLILGLLLAYTYNVRREGITLIFVLLALHFAVLAGRAVRARSANALRDVNWRKVFLPYLAFVVGVATFHLLLPTVLRPNAPGAGLQNVSARMDYYEDVIAEHVGLKDPGLPMQLFSSESAASLAVSLLLMFAAIGVAARLLYRFEEDITLAAYLCCASFIMLVSPYQDGRYLFSITPLLAYFAYQALPTMAALVSDPKGRLVRLAAVPPAIALVGLMYFNAQDLKRSTDYHLVYNYVVHGPETPQAQQMFTAVKELTRGDDVILFFRARAMTLYTDRLAIQGSNLDQLLKRSDWYVMAKGSTYSQALLTEETAAPYGLRKAWENAEWVIWRVSPRA